MLLLGGRAGFILITEFIPVSSFFKDTIRDLASRKQNLLLELRNYEENIKGSTLNPGSVEVDGTQLGVIPANTQLQTAINVNLGQIQYVTFILKYIFRR